MIARLAHTIWQAHRVAVARVAIARWMGGLAVLACVSGATGAHAQGASAILDRVEVNPRRPIDFHAIVLPESVYVGQQATYQVAVLLSPDARSRLRRNPEFLPPELRGLLAYELGTPTRVPPRTFNGAVFEAHIFQRALFPVAAGQQVVPAPQLSYTLPQSSSYFSREERFVVRAESASFVVRPLPLDGRPEDFNGAVGVFTSLVKIDTTSARVGDPLVMTLRVQGTGNVKLLPRPAVELDWASVVPGSERIQVDSSGPLVRGVKEFDWILTPARDGRVAVPPLRYSYFDPYQARYALAISAPVELGVRRGSLAATEEGEGGVLLPLRTGAPSSSEPPVWNGRGVPPNAVLVWLALLALLPVTILWLTAPRAAPRADVGTGREVATTAEREAMGRAHESAVRTIARTARREFLESIASRFALPTQALVSRTHLARVLRRSGVTRQTTRETLALLDTLDELSFALEHTATDAATDTATSADRASRQVPDVMRRIDQEAVPRGRTVGRGIVALLALACGLQLTAPTPLRAQTPAAESPAAESPAAESPAAAQPARPVAASERVAANEAYARRAFIEAAQRFAGLVARSPHDPDLLANWGTAAWAAGDTVQAVIAWQRAARLQPLAADLQERLGLLPSGARGGVADVPMIPVPLLVRVALVCWLLGWSLVGVRRWQSRRSTPFARAARATWIGGVATLTVTVAVVAAVGAWWGARMLDASQLAVVTRPETLRIAPGVDADAMGGVATGDVVRIEESRDIWRRVVHADGRKGWLPGPRLVRLTADSLDDASQRNGTASPVSYRRATDRTRPPADLAALPTATQQQ